MARGGADVLVLSCDAPLEIQRTSAGGTVSLSAGESVGFALEHATSSEPVPQPWTQETVEERLEAAIRG